MSEFEKLTSVWARTRRSRPPGYQLVDPGVEVLDAAVDHQHRHGLGRVLLLGRSIPHCAHQHGDGIADVEVISCRSRWS